MARVTESSWFLEKGGSPQPHQPLEKALPSPPPLLFQSSSPKERHFQTKGPQPPPRAPSMTALALGTNQSSPHYPHHCTRCGCGGWVGAGPSWQWSLGGPLPAESAVPAPAGPPGSSLSTSSRPLSKGSRWGSTVPSHHLRVPVQRKLHQWSFLSGLT